MTFKMIYPAPSDIPIIPTRTPPRSRCSYLQLWIIKISRGWAAMHMSYRGGKYSVERLVALDEYTRNHSLLHAILVCVASFLPSKIFIISQEAVPLQDPRLGWKENYGFWVRAAIVIGAVLYTVIVQAKYLLQGFTISRGQLLVLISCVVVVQMVVAVTFAAIIWFPIPFTIITLVPAFYVVSLGSICMVVGMPVIREVLKHREQVFRFGSFIAAQQFMVVIYPAYQALFHAISDTSYQLPVLLLLPVIKWIVKNLALHCVTHMEDMMPEAVIFTVDFFNALYTATIMKSATSNSAIVILVLIDFVQSAAVLFRLHRRTKSILPRLNEVVGKAGKKVNLLSAANELCRGGDKFQRQNRQRIRIRSCLLHSISVESRELLNRLEIISRTRNSQGRRRYTAPDKQLKVDKEVVFENRLKISKGVTWTDRREQNSTVMVHSDAAYRQSGPQMVVTEHPGVLREALEVLFTAECLLLSAYLGAFVPFFYGIFMYVMIHFQSAKYHAELVGVTTETIGDVVDSILAVCIVELVTLVILAALIYRNLGMNAVYHLAFVLETQTELIQSKLLVWVTMTLAFRVLHFGVDFTFKFAWLNPSN